MKLLDRIEQSIEQLMEGSVNKVFRNQIQPAEIGRKLERAMAANLAASVGGPIAPNDYQVTMHPADLMHVSTYATALTRQFEIWLADTAAQRGYSIIDRMRVQLLAGDSVRRREIRVIATIADRPGHQPEDQHAVQRTEIYRVIKEQTGVAAIRLQARDGRLPAEDVIVRDAVSTLGRATDNTIVLDSHDVSRHHARIELSGGQARIIDLGSTNGTSVNGVKITSQIIRPDDEIAFGTLRFRVDSFGSASNEI